MKVEWLILSDGAQIVGNKLYVLGGGWDLLNVNREFPVTQHMALAASFRLEWAETNMKHNLQIEILTEDGGSLVKVDGQVEVGRPPGIPVGSEQRSQIVIEMNLSIPKTGVYPIVARIEGEEAFRTFFRVVGGKPIQLPDMKLPGP